MKMVKENWLNVSYLREIFLLTLLFKEFTIEGTIMQDLGSDMNTGILGKLEAIEYSR
jgi:hypothetical protein